MSKRKRRLVTGILFLVYFIVLFYFLFFSEEMGRTYSERAYHYNLVPFREIGRFIKYWRVLGMKAVLLNIVGNVATYYSFELSLFVELLQLITKVGSFDVDDLLLNTLGGMIGFLIYQFASHVQKGKDSGKETEKRI